MSDAAPTTPLEQLEKKIQAESGGNIYNAEVDTKIDHDEPAHLIIYIDPHNSTGGGRSSLLRGLYIQEQNNEKIFVSAVMENKIVVRLHPDYKEGITR